MAFNRIAVVLKCGDKADVGIKNVLTTKDSMPATLICEEDYQDTLENIFSDHMKTCYAIVELNPLHKNDVIDFMKSFNDFEYPYQFTISTKNDHLDYRQKTKVLLLEDIATHIGSSTIVNQWRGDNIVPIVDGKSILLSAWKMAIDECPIDPRIFDLNAVSSGTYGVGSGDDYADWAAAFDDIANLTGNLNFEESSAVSDNSKATTTENLGGYKLRCANDSSPNGDPTSGYISTIAVEDRLFNIQCEGNVGGSEVEIDGIYTKRTVSGSSTGHASIYCTNVSLGFTLRAINNMFDGNGSTGGTGVRPATQIVTWEIWNNVIWDHAMTGFDLNNLHTASEVQNNTSYLNAEGFHYYSRNSVNKNNAAYDNDNNDYKQTAGLVTFTKCASSDATGSEVGLQSRSAATDFLSTSDASSDFFDIDTGGALDETGTTSILAANTAGIRERTRPNANTTVSIGAAEIVPVSDLEININDTATITEDIDAELSINVSISDSITIAEDVAISALDLGDTSVSDNITVAEDISTSTLDLGDIAISDSVSITEDVNTSILDLGDVSVFDNIGIAEDIQTSVLDLGEIPISDNISVAENIQMSVLDLGDTSTSDNIAIAENISVAMDLGTINISDSVSVQENIVIWKDMAILISDSIAVAEDISILVKQLIKPLRRIYAINEDNRVYDIKKENRTFPIIKDDREYNT